jgi:hypothetical protein
MIVISGANEIAARAGAHTLSPRAPMGCAEEPSRHA